MDTKFEKYDKSKMFTIKFDVKNCNTSFVNSLRRIIISNVTTIGFNTEDYQDSDIKMIANTSSLHNEFLLHRIGLIPVHTLNIEDYDESKYKFILNEKNESKIIKNITTKDIKVINTETGLEEDNELFFPKNNITKDHILITRLKPSSDGNGEHIHFEGKSSKGIGEQHIRYSPVSCVIFTNKIDPNRRALDLQEYLKGKSGDKKMLTKKFDIEESQRSYYIDSNGDPNVFEFTIESVGVLPPHIILIEGLTELLNKITHFMVEFNKTILKNESIVSIKNSDTLMKAFDVTIHNENHTLGHIIQSYINKLFEEKDIFVGYINPHPLEKKIVYRINVETEDELKTIFEETTKYLIKLCKLLIINVEEEFKLSKAKSKTKTKTAASPKSNAEAGPAKTVEDDASTELDLLKHLEENPELEELNLLDDIEATEKKGKQKKKKFNVKGKGKGKGKEVAEDN